MRYSESRAMLLCYFLVAIWFLGTLFLYAVGNDALQNDIGYRFFADSDTYHKVYSQLQQGLSSPLVGISDNYLGPLALLILFDGSTYLILFFNLTVFFISTIRIAADLNLDPFNTALVWLASPLVFCSLLSVNKEIFIFPFIAFALSGYMRRSLMQICIAFLFSLLVRWQLTFFYVIIVGAMVLDRRGGRRWMVLGCLLASTSILYWSLQELLAPIINFVNASIADYAGGGSGLFEWVLEIQNSGGYFLVFPVKAFHLLFGLGFKLDKILSPMDPWNDRIMGLHCLVTFIVSAATLYKKKWSISSDLMYYSGIFLIVFVLSPVFAPRYLLPVYLMVTLVLVGAPSELRSKIRPSRRTKTKALLATGFTKDHQQRM